MPIGGVGLGPYLKTKLTSPPAMNVYRSLWRASRAGAFSLCVLGAGAYSYEHSPVIYETVNNLCSTYPLASAAISSAVTDGAIPDIIEQSWEGKGFNWRRFGWMAALGAFNGLAVREFYDFNNSLFPGTDTLSRRKRVAFDLIAFTPVNFMVFFSLAHILAHGRSIETALPSAWKKLKKTYIPNALVWGPFLDIIYGLKPHLMVVTKNLLSMVWRSYLINVSQGEENSSKTK